MPFFLTKPLARASQGLPEDGGEFRVGVEQEVLEGHRQGLEGLGKGLRALIYAAVSAGDFSELQALPDEGDVEHPVSVRGEAGGQGGERFCVPFRREPGLHGEPRGAEPVGSAVVARRVCFAPEQGQENLPRAIVKVRVAPDEL